MAEFQFQEWLRELTAAKAGPIMLRGAVRGQSYQGRLRIQGNRVGAVLRMTVKPSPNSPTPFFGFSINPGTFDGTYTTFPFSLNAAQTASIPASPDGVDAYPWDVLLNNNRLVGGVFYITGFVTEPA